MLKTLKSQAFAGPISLHVEYVPHAAAGSDEEKVVLASVRKDAEFLRTALAKAGMETA